MDERHSNESSTTPGGAGTSVTDREPDREWSDPSRPQSGWGPPPGGDEPRAKRRGGWFRVVAAGLVGALIASLAGVGIFVATRDDEPAGARAAVAAPDLTQDPRPLEPTQLNEMIEQVLPSVVNIRTTTFGGSPFGGSGEAQGSGVVIDADGTILTNAHVVSGAVEVEVVFNDGRDPLAGTVVGTNTERDVAVVQVDANDLTPIELGSSANLRLGDQVVALGFPLGLGGPTVTAGIVSGLDRSITVSGGPNGQERLVGVIQTDAAINPGNSGGALVDAAGRLVGINTAGASAAAAENVGFAIPIDEAIAIARDIIANPQAERAWLGIQGAAITSPSQASQLGLPADTQGFVILGVVPGGPAEGAGLAAGEVIVDVDGAEIRTAADLTNALAEHEPGDTVSLRLLSGSAERTVEVELGARPA